MVAGVVLVDDISIVVGIIRAFPEGILTDIEVDCHITAISSGVGYLVVALISIR